MELADETEVSVSVVRERSYTADASGSLVFGNFYTVDESGSPVFDESGSRVLGTTGTGVIEFSASARKSLETKLNDIIKLSGAEISFVDGRDAVKIKGEVDQMQVARDAVHKVLWDTKGEFSVSSSSSMRSRMIFTSPRRKSDKKINWRPWGEEAFQEAETAKKPVILSIGRSTSTWCRAMDVTSFVDEGVINVLESFVCIQVDRDERPDIYQVCQKSIDYFNGWPFIFFITYDMKPIVKITAFPPDLFEVGLRELEEVWADPYKSVRFMGGGILNFERLATLPSSLPKSLSPDLDAMLLCRKKLALWYNPEALKSAWEFPRPVEIQFMLYYKMMAGCLTPEEECIALKEVSETLQCMAISCIHDHIGGGFHTTGSRSREIVGIGGYGHYKYNMNHVPDFEKMLYEQGQLASVYLDAFFLTNDGLFSRVSRDILDFVKREMIGLEGQIYSALDADSGESKGLARIQGSSFYKWTAKEVKYILQERAVLFLRHYELKSSVLWLMSDPDNELMGVDVFSEQLGSGISKHDLRILGECRKKLFDERSCRPGPPLDKKVIVSWNGLAISSFARASIILKREAEGTEFYFPVAGCNPKEYMEVAKSAASFIRQKLYNSRAVRLKHYLRDGVQYEEDGFLEDYAFLISGLLDLYEYGGEIEWLEWATDLQDAQNELFLDCKGGGYFTNTGKDPLVKVRVKEDYDGEVPSGNSVSAINLLRFASMMLERSDDYRYKAGHLLAAFEKRLKCMPTAAPLMCCAAYMSKLPTELVVLVGSKRSVEFDEKLTAAHASYNPSRRVIHIDPTNKKDMRFWGLNNRYIFNLANNYQRSRLDGVHVQHVQM